MHSSLRDNSSYGNMKLKSSCNTAVSKDTVQFTNKVALRRAVTWDTTILNDDFLIIAIRFTLIHTVTKESDLDCRECVLKKATLSYSRRYFCDVLCFSGFAKKLLPLCLHFFQFVTIIINNKMLNTKKYRVLSFAVLWKGRETQK